MMPPTTSDQPRQNPSALLLLDTHVLRVKQGENSKLKPLGAHIVESGDAALCRNGRYSVMNLRAIGSRYYLIHVPQNTLLQAVEKLSGECKTRQDLTFTG